MTTIALIDDHLIVRSGFAQLLGWKLIFRLSPNLVAAARR
ncbi:transcriptional regulatory protein UhpA [Klebsiella pneumoniae]|nr:transcriptional regulatory protein UhpA [Klebsiella pneumoniae]